MLRRFFHDQRGGAAITFAGTGAALLAAVAFGVDYTRMVNLRTQIQSAADAAVLDGVSSSALNRALSNGQQVQASKARAAASFSANLAQIGVSMPSSEISGSMNGKTGEISLQLDWSTNYNSAFGKSITATSRPLTGTSTAKSATTTYIEIIALIDASGSMGIGASEADQQAMLASDKTRNCAFACHVVGTDAEARKLKKSNGDPVQLRFDVVRSAFLDILGRAGSLNGPSDQVKVSVYKFSNRLTTIQPPTTSISSAVSAVRGMELDGAGGAGTNYSAVMQDLLPLVQSGGDGSSATSRKTFFMLLTDGIADDVMETADAANYEWGNWSPDPRWVTFQPSFLASGENLQGLDASLCSPYKSKNITVLTLNIDYIIPPNPDWRFQTIRDRLKGSINQNMNACASGANLTFNASAPGSIKQAINTMFDTIVASARLTR